MPANASVLANAEARQVRGLMISAGTIGEGALKLFQLAWDLLGSISPDGAIAKFTPDRVVMNSYSYTHRAMAGLMGRDG
jgi:hypothetical protein